MWILYTTLYKLFMSHSINLSCHSIWIPHITLSELVKQHSMNSSYQIPYITLNEFLVHLLWIPHSSHYEFHPYELLISPYMKLLTLPFMNSSHYPNWIPHTTLYEFLISSSMNTSQYPILITILLIMNYMNSSYNPIWIPHTTLYKLLIPPSMNSSYHTL